jgi:hypothetical protein
MKPEFNGIERCLDKLNERLARLEAIKDKPRTDYRFSEYPRSQIFRHRLGYCLRTPGKA